MKSIKYVITFLLLLSAFDTWGDAKFASYSLRKVIRSVRMGKKIESNLQQQLKPLQARYSASKNTLVKLQKKLQSDLTSLSARQRKKRKTEVVTAFIKNKKLLQQLQQQERSLRQRLYAPLKELVHRAVEDVMQMQGYSVLLERELPGILYVNAKQDATPFVIARVEDFYKR